ncbi:MAG: type I methionyl aminopeptidase [Campylobacteraceae bacterium]|nr:type I methionyl aminopeptidase [Campylobacteraceae bacterium]
MAIHIRNKSEIDALRRANKIAAEAISFAVGLVKPGVSTKFISEESERFIVSKNARASFKGLYGFPEAICISVNEVIIHGIPDETVLKDGDIVGLDIGTELDGWYGDTAVTVPVGSVSKEDEELIACAKDSLDFAISSIKEGMRFKELSKIIEDYIEAKGYKPLRNFCGHGIGRSPHEEPSILNYVEGNPSQGPKIKNGMVFCIEPMICQKDGGSKILKDKWSVVSNDGLRGSHYEHTVAIVNGRAEVLSRI